MARRRSPAAFGSLLSHIRDSNILCLVRGKPPFLRVAGLSLVFLIWGCVGLNEREEIIGETPIPVPAGMERLEGGSVELALPGFGGGSAAFQGRVTPEEVVKFYRREMPSRGWKENASLVGRGGALAFSKEGRSIVITVSSGNDGTTLSIAVGRLGG